jgi:hypothetical protein
MGASRNRIRPPGTLQTRLLAMAGIARRKAKELPEGPQRLQLLQKADLSERTAAIERWLSSPNLQPPR